MHYPYPHDLVSNAVSRLRDLALDKREGAYVGHSGGKDSCLITALVTLAYPDHTFPLVHTVKVHETHPKTVQFLYTLNMIVVYTPKELHGDLGASLQIDGTRIAEATRDDGRSTDFVSQGVNKSRKELTLFVPDGLFGLDFVFPIFDWTDEQVWDTIKALKIPVSEEYEAEIAKYDLQW